MSIFSRIDPQSLSLTRKLLEKRSPALSQALPVNAQSRYPVNEITIELDSDTVNGIINELTLIGQSWLQDEGNDCYDERKQIMAYLLKQWIKVGEDTMYLNQSNSHSIH